VMVAYDYSCDGGIFFRGHSCQVDGFYDAFIV
jgi:hypothetical protein